MTNDHALWQVGRKFACGSNNRGHVKYALDHALRDCKDEKERQHLSDSMDAAQKALHYHTGIEVRQPLFPSQASTSILNASLLYSRTCPADAYLPLTCCDAVIELQGELAAAINNFRQNAWSQHLQSAHVSCREANW